MVGRRTSPILGLAGLGCLSLANAQADTLLSLGFVTGFALGEITPNAVSLAGEYALRGGRSLASTITICGFSGGASAGGFLAGQMLDYFTWRSVFYMGGVVPLLLVLPAITWLPETARLLASKRNKPEQLARLLSPSFLSRLSSPTIASYFRKRRSRASWAAKGARP